MDERNDPCFQFCEHWMTFRFLSFLSFFVLRSSLPPFPSPSFLSFLPFFLSSLLPFFILYSFFLYTASSALVAIGTLLILLSTFRLPLNLPVYFGGFVDVDHIGHKPEVATQWIYVNIIVQKQMHSFVFQDCCRICAPQKKLEVSQESCWIELRSCHKDVEHILQAVCDASIPSNFWGWAGNSGWSPIWFPVSQN